MAICEIEPGFYDLRTVINNNKGEIETVYRTGVYVIDREHYCEKRNEWKNDLLKYGHTVLQEITYKRSIDQNQILW